MLVSADRVEIAEDRFVLTPSGESSFKMRVDGFSTEDTLLIMDLMIDCIEF